MAVYQKQLKAIAFYETVGQKIFCIWYNEMWLIYTERERERERDNEREIFAHIVTRVSIWAYCSILL